ncbi:50S ribosomal protein L4 [Fusibacter sp. JL216-2]|uniref:50S ribosomal protein L4 n=1 Tax=Fusibacter sp. JL216-2 TaxID=3071453 RepID=UPI003D32880B
MPKHDILNVSGQKVGEIELNDSIFATEVNEAVLHEVVKNYLANQRQGTFAARTRSEVRGGGKKPYRQKGTGRARQGTTRAPHFVGGGVAFAKKSRDFSYRLNKKVKRLALKSALSAKVNNNELIVIDELNLEAPKTKDMVNILSNVNAAKKALVVTADKNENVIRSANNIKGVATAEVLGVNVYQLLHHDTCIITKDAVQKIEEVYA